LVVSRFICLVVSWRYASCVTFVSWLSSTKLAGMALLR
jgi:hypothetical protein